MSLYKFMNMTIGDLSYDNYTFKLFRKLKDTKIRKYPGTIGLSTAVLMDLVKKGTKLIVVVVDGKAIFKTNPRKWLELGKIDKLTPDQDPHAFLHIDNFDVIDEYKKERKQVTEDGDLNNFLNKKNA